MIDLEFGDMIFYSVAGMILILLFWLRFMEQQFGLWGAWLVWAVWSAYLFACYLQVRRKRRPASNATSAKGDAR